MKVWHYKFASTGSGEGWAHIMIREDGFFATVSDYGNYAYWWTSTGKSDIREFFLRADVEWDYFAGKLGPKKELDVEGSFEAVLQDIANELHAGRIDVSEAAEQTKHVKMFQDDEDWEGFIRDDATFEYLDEPFRFGRMRRDPDVDAYAKKILPRLVVAIKAELQSEANGSSAITV